MLIAGLAGLLDRSAWRSRGFPTSNKHSNTYPILDNSSERSSKLILARCRPCHRRKAALVPNGTVESSPQLEVSDCYHGALIHETD